MATKIAKSETEEKPQPREPIVAQPSSVDHFETVNCRWRHVAAAGITTEDLERPGYLARLATKIADFDLVDVFSADRTKYWQCLVIQGGRGDGTTGGGAVRMIVLPNYPIEIPALDRWANDGLPAGYRIDFNSFTRRHVPVWGETLLNADGMARWEDARALVLHHCSQAASVQPRPSEG